MYGSERLASDLRTLGVREGDTVLLRAAAKAIGPTTESSAATLLDAALRAVGIDGTLVALAFTASSWSRRRDPAHVFRKDTPTISGGLAAAMLSHPLAVRSAHPTNSFVAIGRHAEDILQGHTGNAGSFFPMNQIVARSGKMVLVGCAGTSPGFSTVHLVQEHIGLATRTLLSGQLGCYVEEDGRRRWYARPDVAGCSAGFGRFYAKYVENGLLHAGYVGDAYSLLIAASPAYALELDVLKADPRFALCTNPDCLTCRGMLLYNKRDMPGYVVRWLRRKVGKAFSRRG